MGQLPRGRRITTRREIGGLLSGRRVRGADLELFWRPAARPAPRGTCITPKFGHSSVERNRLRRRLKELIRHTLLTRPEALDYLIRARPSAYERSFAELKSALDELVARIDAEPDASQPEEA